MRRVFFGGGLLGLVALAVAAGGWWALNAPVPLAEGGAVVTVQSGEPFRITAERLAAAGVVRSAWLARLWARATQADRAARAGTYRFSAPVSIRQVLDMLRSPTSALRSVTVPEGSTVAETIAALAAAGLGGADRFWCAASDPAFLARLDLPVTGLEGYLFPDTYAFEPGASPEDILTTMVGRFRAVTAAWHGPRIAADLTEAEAVTLASIVEKETGVDGERAIVAGVFRNRLRIGMPLQADPTVVYGRVGRPVPTAADVDRPSPYNTYLHRGLPPGPICNPGLAALEAAVSPADVPYLYFVARQDGMHEFSRTLEEHNRAVARQRRRERGGGA